MKYDALIVASGKGQRSNLGYNKVFYVMKDGKNVLDHSLSLFMADPDCEKIVVVTNEEYFNEIKDDQKIIKVKGGKERKDSVNNGLKEVSSEYVLIHDGARPFLHPEALKAVKEKLNECNACVLGRMALDTIKYVENGRIMRTIDRNNIFLAETPQAFRSELIKDCYARADETIFTDDASLAEAFGHEVMIVIDEYDNRKLTTQEDFRKL